MTMLLRNQPPVTTSAAFASEGAYVEMHDIPQSQATRPRFRPAGGVVSGDRSDRGFFGRASTTRLSGDGYVNVPVPVKRLPSGRSGSSSSSSSGNRGHRDAYEVYGLPGYSLSPDLPSGSLGNGSFSESSEFSPVGSSGFSTLGPDNPQQPSSGSIESGYVLMSLGGQGELNEGEGEGTQSDDDDDKE